MASITFDTASFVFPNFDVSERSLKKRIIGKFNGTQSSQRSVGRDARFSSGLFDISLKVRSGDRLGIVGANGAGKSTLLRSISGVYHPVAGCLNVDGRVSSLLNIGIGTDAFATGLENIFIKGIGLGISLAEIKPKVDEIICFSELGDSIFDPVRTYSTGMYMRLIFAIVTAFKKDIVLMDEWLSVGDHHFNRKAEKKLMEFVEGSEILVIASHNRGQIENLCNKAIYLKGGRLECIGSPKEVCDIYWETV